MAVGYARVVDGRVNENVREGGGAQVAEQMLGRVTSMQVFHAIKKVNSEKDSHIVFVLATAAPHPSSLPLVCVYGKSEDHKRGTG